MQSRDLSILIPVFLLAAGCMTRSEFGDQAGKLTCEIQQACGESCQGISFSSSGSCGRFQPQKGAQCIEALEEMLVTAQGEDAQPVCSDFIEWPSICDRVIKNPSNCGPGVVSVEGRPLWQGTQALLAQVQRTDETENPERGPAARRAGEAWLQAARYEHASIAAFERLAVELGSLGAPRELVHACTHAAEQERTHTRLCLEIAEGLLGQRLELGPVPAATPRQAHVETLALEALLDGCAGEGAASLRAREAADLCAPEFRAACLQIAQDELEHASLSWKILSWALACTPSLSAKLRRALEARLASVAPNSSRRVQASLSRYGILDSSRTAELEGELLTQVVMPVFEAVATTRLSASRTPA